MSKRVTQKQIMTDLVIDLNILHSPQGWEFNQVKYRGVKHCLEGENVDSDRYILFTVPMHLMQRSAMSYFDTLYNFVLAPVRDLVDKPLDK